MMAWEYVVNKLKRLVLVVFGLIKRSLCCFKRRRRSSCDPIPLTGIGIGTPYPDTSNNDMENWVWEEPPHVITEPNSVQHHIEMYRQQKSTHGQQENVEEPDPDFFEDMTPKITTQVKYHLRSTEQENKMSSRLNFVPESIPEVSAELGSWEEREHQRNSWEDEGSWDVSQIVRETRRAERERQAALKREQGRSTLGSKVS